MRISFPPPRVCCYKTSPQSQWTVVSLPVTPLSSTSYEAGVTKQKKRTKRRKKRQSVEAEGLLTFLLAFVLRSLLLLLGHRLGHFSVTWKQKTNNSKPGDTVRHLEQETQFNMSNCTWNQDTPYSPYRVGLGGLTVLWFTWVLSF